MSLFVFLFVPISTTEAWGSDRDLVSVLVAPVLVMIVPLAWELGRKRWQRGGLALGACLAVVGCATLSNWNRAHEFVPISANGGINLYIGNHPDSDRMVAIRPGAE